MHISVKWIKSPQDSFDNIAELFALWKYTLLDALIMSAFDRFLNLLQ